MPLRIRLPNSAFADDLFDFLLQVGADVRRVGHVVYVIRRHPVVAGEPPDQDRVELEFVTRLWSERTGADPEFEVEEAA
jgi:hypothetical protein